MITITVLGGVSIFGGSGTMVGAVLALVLVGILRFGMGLINLQGQVQDIVIGLLLILSILLPRLGSQIQLQAAVAPGCRFQRGRSREPGRPVRHLLFLVARFHPDPSSVPEPTRSFALLYAGRTIAQGGSLLPIHRMSVLHTASAACRIYPRQAAHVNFVKAICHL